PSLQRLAETLPDPRDDAGVPVGPVGDPSRVVEVDERGVRALHPGHRLLHGLLAFLITAVGGAFRADDDVSATGLDDVANRRTQHAARAHLALNLGPGHPHLLHLVADHGPREA